MIASRSSAAAGAAIHPSATSALCVSTTYRGTGCGTFPSSAISGAFCGNSCSVASFRFLC